MVGKFYTNVSKLKLKLRLIAIKRHVRAKVRAMKRESRQCISLQLLTVSLYVSPTLYNIYPLI